MTTVCHVTSAHPQEDGRIFQKECTSLARAGYSVYLVQRGDSYQKNGVQVVGFGPVKGNRLTRMTKYANKAYKAALRVNADVYHLHDPELLPYALLLKKHRKRVIFDSHEVYYEQIRNKSYLHWPLNVIVAELYKRFETKVFDSIDGVILSSTRNGAMPVSTKNNNIITIDNCPGLELYHSYSPETSKEPRSICCFGTLSYARGITSLVKAAYKANGKLYLAGNIHSVQYKEELESMPEYKTAHYLGVLQKEEVTQYLQHMCIGYAALLNIGQYNKDDNLPTKAYEYMALGIPVLLTRTKSREVLISACPFGICVDPSNIDEIENAIEFLLSNPEKARELGENGRKLIREKFNWEIEAEKLLSFYKKLIQPDGHMG